MSTQVASRIRRVRRSLDDRVRSLLVLRARFRRFFSLSVNKPPARQAIKLTLKIRSTKMRCLEIARDSESLFFLITPWGCSRGVASFLKSAIYRSAVNRLKRTRSRLMGCFSCTLFISSRNAPQITAAKEARYAKSVLNLSKRNLNFTRQIILKPLFIEKGK